ncbi:ferrous iron transport protein B [Candidatus Agathobaculum pullicola]|uniref:ferrous iron transport protein B n=1 Tax=Candidatus Agathobaculum pullicola TaxID=2838426 RepID=UPI003F90F24A
MSIRLALAGNPNCGKTTMFNDLTGSTQYVGNWPGVTVEKKEGRYKADKQVSITDLPGIYSLSPYTLEEVITRDYLVGEKPDAILNLVDAANIERNLYLTTQLLEMGIPVVVALNMMDIVAKRGDVIDTEKLSAGLGVPVVETTALKGKGTKELVETAKRAVAAGAKPAAPAFSDTIEQAIGQIAALIADVTEEDQRRWFAVKLFERDEKVLARFHFGKDTVEKLESIITAVEDALDDDAESIITDARYQYITQVVTSCVKKKKSGMTASDKIDRIVTNRILALPIFALVMFVVYYVSVTTVGTALTNWANDGVFGDGWHLFGIGSGAYAEADAAYQDDVTRRDAWLGAAEREGVDVSTLTALLSDEEADTAAIEQAGAALTDDAAHVVGTAEFKDENTGKVTTEQVDFAAFQGTLTAQEADPADYGIWVPGIPVLIGGALSGLGIADWLYSLIMDGIVAGVGAVLGFVPQILVLFLFLAILEDCGYMARVAFIMDRIFRKFGLSGKSFIPMLIGTGCGVPGIMASRTIEQERDRRMTIMTTTFIPCSAKLPIIALIAGAIFDNAGWVAFSAYFIGVMAIILSGIMLKKFKMFAGEPAPFVMELPSYHTPTAGNVLRSMGERGWSFIKKAGTVILLSTVVLWFLQTYGWENGAFGAVSDINNSALAAIGSAIAPLFAPLGWGTWQNSVASVTGLIAKENVVATFGQIYGFAEVAEDGAEIWGLLAASFTTVSAFSFMCFNLLCAPCFAAMGAIKREMNNAKWTVFAIGYMCVFAYCVALMVYQFGGLLTGEVTFGPGTVAAVLVLALMVYLLLRKPAAADDTANLRRMSVQANS